MYWISGLKLRLKRPKMVLTNAVDGELYTTKTLLTGVW
jgi:hypothetical protein